MNRLPRIKGGAIAVPFTRAARKDELAELRAKGADIFELRLDLADSATPDSAQKMAASFAGHPLIVTCRCKKEGGKGGDDIERLLLLASTLEHATAIDVELSSASILQQASELARTNRCELIVSCHKYKNMPSIDFLDEVVEQAMVAEADIVKIVTVVSSQNDIDKLVGFLERHLDDKRSMAVMGMGEDVFSANSRVQLAKHGSIFVFGSSEAKTAPGIPSLEWLTQNMRPS